MAEYTLEFSSSAARQFRKLPPQVQQRLAKKLDQLTANPRLPGYEALTGQPGFRIRVGDYRIIYDVYEQVLIVRVLRIAHRRHVYNR